MREEGCLSLPGQYADVDAPGRVTVRYQDQAGAKQEIEAEGLLAACLQHEIDHLDGVLFVDHLSALKRNMILRRLAKEHAAEARRGRVALSLRLAFMGSPDFAVPALRALRRGRPRDRRGVLPAAEARPGAGKRCGAARCMWRPTRWGWRCARRRGCSATPTRMRRSRRWIWMRRWWRPMG